MNQKDFLTRVADELGESIASVKRFYTAFKDTAKKVVAEEDDEVRLSGFLKIGTKVRKERTGFNPSSKEKILIPAQRVSYVKILGDWKKLETY